MIRKILVALDGSPRAPAVFRAAADLGALFRATVRPFRAVSIPPEFPAAAFGSPPDPLPQYLMNLALDDLRRLTERRSDVEVEPPIMRVGDPSRLIVAMSDELGVDLVVIGSHGYRGLDRVLGTTAARVADLAKCSVLVVHEPSAPGHASRPEGLPGADP